MAKRRDWTYQDLVDAFKEWRDQPRYAYNSYWIGVDESWRRYCKIRDEMGYMPEVPPHIQAKIKEPIRITRP